MLFRSRFMPKMNQHRCKTRVRGAKRAAGCPENRLLSTKSGVRPQRWSPGPQCPSRERKQGVYQKPEQTEVVKRSQTETHDRRLRKSKTGLQTRKVVCDHKKWSTTTKEWSTRPLPPSGKENQTWSANRVKAQRVQRPGGKALSRNSGNSKQAQHALSPSAQSVMSES